MNLDEAKPNGHAEPVTRAWDARLARIEQRLADIAETGEQYPSATSPTAPSGIAPTPGSCWRHGARRAR
jgi:hypothetical protein